MVTRTFRVGNYQADLYVDAKAAPPLCHFVVTRQDSPEIVAWGQERSLEAAEQSARDAMGYMADGDSARSQRAERGKSSA